MSSSRCPLSRRGGDPARIRRSLSRRREVATTPSPADVAPSLVVPSGESRNRRRSVEEEMKTDSRPMVLEGHYTGRGRRILPHGSARIDNYENYNFYS